MAFRNSSWDPRGVARGVLSVLLLLVSAPASATDDLAVSFTGFLYEAAGDGGPDPTPGEALAVGDGYVFVGHVVAFADGMLPHVDTANHEYTVVITGGVVNTRSSFPPVQYAFLGGTVRLEVYEDAIAGGTPATPTANPPNVGVPAHYADGTLVLGGSVTGFNIAWIETSRQGNWSAEIEFDEGRLLPYAPTRRSDKRLFVGGQTTADPTPAGYHFPSAGEARSYWILPVEAHSWGQLKTRFR